jgi:hypothetical protein
MKKTILVGAISLMLLSARSFAATSVDFGNLNPIESPISFKVSLERIQNSQTIRVIFEKPLEKSLRVSLTDPFGAEIFSFNVNMKTKIIYQNFNFSDADFGIYKLAISDKKTVVVKQIKIERVKPVESTSMTIE